MLKFNPLFQRKGSGVKMKKILLLASTILLGGACVTTSYSDQVARTASVGAIAAALAARSMGCVETLLVDGKPSGQCVHPDGRVTSCAGIPANQMCSF